MKSRELESLPQHHSQKIDIILNQNQVNRIGSAITNTESKQTSQRSFPVYHNNQSKQQIAPTEYSNKKLEEQNVGYYSHKRHKSLNQKEKMLQNYVNNSGYSYQQMNDLQQVRMSQQAFLQ